MAGQTNGGRDGAPIIQQTTTEHPKGLLDALAELETISAQEINGAEVDKRFVTTREQIHLGELGFRGVSVSKFLLFLCVPIAECASRGMIPVFGSYNPSLFDKFFVYLTAFTFLIAYSLFLARAVSTFYGEYTHKMVKSLLVGIIPGALLWGVVACLFYYFLATKVLTEENILRSMTLLAKWISPEKLAGPYRWFLEFNPVLMASAYWVVGATAIFIGIIIGSYRSALSRNRKLRERGFK